MQILKTSKKKEFNKFVPKNPHYTEISLDKKVTMMLACRDMPSTFSEWRDSDGSIFPSYSELLDYQVDKFTRRYPPNFCREVKPEMAVITDNNISWNKEVVRILMMDSYEWGEIKKGIDEAILRWYHFDFEKYQYSPDLLSIKRETVEEALNTFITELNKLIK